MKRPIMSEHKNTRHKYQQMVVNEKIGMWLLPRSDRFILTCRIPSGHFYVNKKIYAEGVITTLTFIQSIDQFVIMNTLWVIYSHIDIKGEICSRTYIVRVVLRKKENLYKKSVAALEVTRNSLIFGNKKQPI